MGHGSIDYGGAASGEILQGCAEMTSGWLEKKGITLPDIPPNSGLEILPELIFVARTDD